jgi:hypothetical protein
MGWKHTVIVIVAGLFLTVCSASGNGGSRSPSEAASVPAGDVGFTVGEELDPGEYTSQVFETPVTFTVPAGWKVFEDEPGQFGLARMANDGPPLLIMRDIDAAAPGCPPHAQPGVGRGAADLTQSVGSRKGVVTTKPVAVTVGGLNGYVMDVNLDPSWAKSCPDITTGPSVMTIIGSPPLSRGVLWGPERTRMQRMWSLDLSSVEDGNIVVMGDVCCGVDQADQLQADQQVVDSLLFDTTSD